MIKRYIHSLRCILSAQADDATGFAELKSQLPGRSARRMSHLGVLLHHVLQDMPVHAASSLVYATTFSEAEALQHYLDSFPHASPTAFQTSIHPGGVEQALILAKRAVGSFLPLAGQDGIFAHALMLGLQSPAADCVVCGGEEKGGWLLEFGLSSDHSFAFALHVSPTEAGSIASVGWDFDYPPTANTACVPTLSEAAAALQEHRDLDFVDPAWGRFVINWKSA